ncbi:unnamed protein product [Heligmosomoides polygyrus]|uniref:Uncharacterized protein n=1 Tax=Heligmosomoides polygyrus TaxID=6339 RepID=A0A183GBR2_HELPZ|nr:unnamed protein product [Heligmosomoides polygyrus]
MLANFPPQPFLDRCGDGLSTTNEWKSEEPGSGSKPNPRDCLICKLCQDSSRDPIYAWQRKPSNEDCCASNETSPYYSNSASSYSPSELDFYDAMEAGGDQGDYMAAGPSGLQSRIVGDGWLVCTFRWTIALLPEFRETSEEGPRMRANCFHRALNDQLDVVDFPGYTGTERQVYVETLCWI